MGGVNPLGLSRGGAFPVSSGKKMFSTSEEDETEDRDEDVAKRRGRGFRRKCFGEKG